MFINKHVEMFYKSFINEWKKDIVQTTGSISGCQERNEGERTVAIIVDLENTEGEATPGERIAPPKTIGEKTSGHISNGDRIKGDRTYGLNTFGART